MSNTSTPDKIFDINDYRNMKRLQRAIVDLRGLLEKSGNCGIDVTNENGACDGMEHFLTQMEANFFPVTPSEALDIQ